MKIEVQTARGVANFRRCGLAFERDPITLDTDKLDDDVVAALRAEPRLIVTERDADAKPAKKAKA